MVLKKLYIKLIQMLSSCQESRIKASNKGPPVVIFDCKLVIT